eukprot:EG_transcript_37024
MSVAAPHDGSDVKCPRCKSVVPWWMIWGITWFVAQNMTRPHAGTQFHPSSDPNSRNAARREEALLELGRSLESCRGVTHKEAIKVEIDKLKAEENRKKQKTDAPAINPASFAAS